MSDLNKDVAQDAAKLVWGEKGNQQEYVLDKAGATSIGREKGREITLADQKVSKLHAIVAWSEKGFTITDQGSSNGTIINGKEIQAPTILNDGDKILIGSTTLKYIGFDIAQVEELKTRIFQRSSADAAAKEAGKSKDEVEEMETRVFESTPPKAPSKKEDVAESVPGKETGKGLNEITGVVDGLSGLIEQVNATREMAERLRDEQEKSKTRMVSTVSNLNSIAAELEKIVVQTLELDTQIQESEFIKLLSELSKKPSDVNLLVQLAGHAELLGNLAKSISAHATGLDKIKRSLKNELADFTGAS